MAKGQDPGVIVRHNISVGRFIDGLLNMEYTVGPIYNLHNQDNQVLSRGYGA